jgi:hypothetical protein
MHSASVSPLELEMLAGSVFYTTSWFLRNNLRYRPWHNTELLLEIEQ